MNTIIIGDGPLTVDALTAIARAGAKVELSPSARERVTGRTGARGDVGPGRAGPSTE